MPQMTSDGKYWFPFSEDHLLVSIKLTPCANLLWQWILLRDPDSTVEVDLRDFQKVTNFRSRGCYPMKVIKHAVKELENRQLIAVTRSDCKGDRRKQPPQCVSAHK